jgi:hypothetical protein
VQIDRDLAIKPKEELKTMLKKILCSLCFAGLVSIGNSAFAIESTPAETALVNGDFAYLDKYLTELQAKFEAGKATELELRDAYRIFYALDPLQFQTLDAWTKNLPKSYAAHLAKGVAYSIAAYKARGTQFIDKTPEHKMDEMGRLMNIAARELNASLPLTAKPYLTYYNLIDVFRVCGEFEGARWATDKAERILPHNYLVNTIYIGNLVPKWGGSYEQMLAFIEERKKDSPQSEILALEAIYYNDMGQAAARRHDNRAAHDNYVEALKRSNVVGGTLRRDYLGSANYWVCNSTKEAEYCPKAKSAKD